MNSSHQNGSHVVALHMFKDLTWYNGLQSESFGSKNVDFGWKMKNPQHWKLQF
jgi:hypothetical protein